ncbi:MAG: winged helix-turn-helix transcriptional regulator [Thermoplasmata archaeon]|nr:winged helix-turn-helix transcriptional regulator [Thermoplasmata archaeon]
MSGEALGAAVWSDVREGNTEIYGVVLDPTGNPEGSEIRISRTPGMSIFPSCVVDGWSRIHITWLEMTVNGWDVYYSLVEDSVVVKTVKIAHIADRLSMPPSPSSPSISQDVSLGSEASWPSGAKDRRTTVEAAMLAPSIVLSPQDTPLIFSPSHFNGSYKLFVYEIKNHGVGAGDMISSQCLTPSSRDDVGYVKALAIRGMRVGYKDGTGSQDAEDGNEIWVGWTEMGSNNSLHMARYYPQLHSLGPVVFLDSQKMEGKYVYSLSPFAVKKETNSTEAGADVRGEGGGKGNTERSGGVLAAWTYKKTEAQGSQSMYVEFTYVERGMVAGHGFFVDLGPVYELSLSPSSSGCWILISSEGWVGGGLKAYHISDSLRTGEREVVDWEHGGGRISTASFPGKGAESEDGGRHPVVVWERDEGNTREIYISQRREAVYQGAPVPGSPEDDSTPFFYPAAVGFSLLGILYIASRRVFSGGMFLRGGGGLMPWSSFPAFLPGYSRLTDEDVLENPTRRRILDYIYRNPGANFSAMMSSLEMKNGVLSHHLRILERRGYILSKKDGAFRRYYLFSQSPPPTLEEKILHILSSRPGINQSDLAKEVGVSRQVINYHIKRMTESGRVLVKREGKSSRCYAISMP